MRLPRYVNNVTAGSSSLRAILWCAAMWCFCAPASPARAQVEYVNRNNTEFYPAYVVWDNLSFSNPAENHLWQDEFSRRYLAVTYGEARVNRKFFVDVAAEGIWPIDMPGYPQQDPGGSGVVEVAFVNPTDLTQTDSRDVALRAEMFGYGHPAKNWDLGIHLATRVHLRQTLIPAEVSARAILTHHGFAGLKPVDTGFFFGPEIRPLDVAIGGVTVGGFALMSTSKAAMTKATVKLSWWGDADPFQNLMQLRLGQMMSFWHRNINLQVSGGADLRQVRQERYVADFGVEPERTRYIDLVLESSVLTVLPYKFRLDVAGRLVPIHTPDQALVRWYRQVGPQLSVALERKVAIFDFSAGYTFTLVPPRPEEDVDYVDSGSGIIPGSTPGHLFSFTLGLKI